MAVAAAGGERERPPTPPASRGEIGLPDGVPLHLVLSMVHDSLAGAAEDRLRPLREVVPRSGGVWNRVVSSSQLLRAVASRNEVVLRQVLGGSPDSPRLPLPMAPVAELVCVDDRGRTPLDWARLMSWHEGVVLIEEAMRRVRSELEPLVEAQAALRDAALLAATNVALAAEMADALAQPLESAWEDGCTAVLGRASASGARQEDVREAVARVRRAGLATVGQAIAHSPPGHAAAGLSEQTVMGDPPVPFFADMATTSAAASSTTPLMRASSTGHARLVSELLKAGADPSLSTPGGRLPLAAACARGHEIVAKLIVGAGADPFALRETEGACETPLIAAAARNQHRIVAWLLDKAKVATLVPALAAGRPVLEPFAAPRHWCQDFLRLLNDTDSEGRAAADRAPEGSIARRLLTTRRSSAEDRIAAWRATQHQRRWASCPRCGERLPNEQMARHMARLCEAREVVTPRRRRLGTNRPPPASSVVRPHELGAVLDRLKPAYNHRQAPAEEPERTPGPGELRPTQAHASSVTLAGSAEPPSHGLTRERAALARKLVSRRAAPASSIAQGERAGPRVSKVTPPAAQAPLPDLQATLPAGRWVRPRAAEPACSPQCGAESKHAGASRLVCPLGCGQALASAALLSTHVARRCELRVVPCRLECGQSVRAMDVSAHEESDCPMRQVACALCGVMVAVRRQDEHARKECAGRSVVCPNVCGERVEARHVPAHLSDHCICRRVPCPLECGAWVMARLVDRHCSDECALRRVACRHEGCTEQMPVEDEPGHAAGCAHRPVACQFCGTLLPAAAIDDHVPLCDQGRRPCPQGCGAVLDAAEAEHHCRSECPRRVLPCPNGCGQEVGAWRRSQHTEEECPLRTVQCPNSCGDRYHAGAEAVHARVCPRRATSCELNCPSCARRASSWLLGRRGDARLLLCALHGSSPLHAGAAAGDLDLVQDMAESCRPDELERPNGSGMPPLSVACARAQADAARLLLELGADPVLESEKGMTPLLAAVQGGDPRCVEMLLEAGASPSTRNRRGISAIRLASSLRRSGLLSLLRKHAHVAAELASMHRAILRHDHGSLAVLLGGRRPRRESRAGGDARAGGVVLGQGAPRASREPARGEDWATEWALEARARKKASSREAAARAACRIVAASVMAATSAAASGGSDAGGPVGASSIHESHDIEGPLVRRRVADPVNRASHAGALRDRVRQFGEAHHRAELAQQRLSAFRALHARTTLRHSLLSFASACGARGCATLLLRHGASPNYSLRAWDAAASAIQLQWRAATGRLVPRVADRLAGRTWLERLLERLASRSLVRRACRRLMLALSQERLPIHEAAFAGQPELVGLLVAARARPWLACRAVCEPPPPFGMQRPVRFLTSRPAVSTQPAVVTDLIVRVPRLDAAGDVLAEDDVHAASRRKVPSLALSGLPGSVGDGGAEFQAVWQKPSDVLGDGRDAPSGAVGGPAALGDPGPSRESADAPASKWYVDSATGRVTLYRPAGSSDGARLAMPDDRLIGCTVLPRPAFLVESAALGYGRLGHQHFVEGQGWVASDEHVAALRRCKDITVAAALARRRGADARRMARNRRDVARLQKSLAAEVASAIRTSDADGLLRCLRRGLTAEHVDTESGHSIATAAALIGGVVRDPGSGRRAPLLRVAVERFATDPRRLLDGTARCFATPLMAAASRGNEAEVAFLVGAGASVSAALGPLADERGEGPHALLPHMARRRLEGATALHFAAAAGRTEATRQLVASGADIGATTAHGDTAADLALESGHATLMAELVAAAGGAAIARSTTLGAGGVRFLPCEWGCGARVAAGTESQHDTVCPRRLVPCPLGCADTALFASDVDSHCRNECPLRLCRCPFGCGPVLRGSELRDHLERCPGRLETPADIRHKVAAVAAARRQEAGSRTLQHAVVLRRAAPRSRRPPGVFAPPRAAPVRSPGLRK